MTHKLTLTVIYTLAFLSLGIVASVVADSTIINIAVAGGTGN